MENYILSLKTLVKMIRPNPRVLQFIISHACGCHLTPEDIPGTYYQTEDE
jgi:hypothetical protein